MKRKNFRIGKSFYQKSDWSKWDEFLFRNQIVSLKWIAFQLHMQNEFSMEAVLNSVVAYLESLIGKDNEEEHDE